jgi:hypothetical protein
MTTPREDPIAPSHNAQIIRHHHRSFMGNGLRCTLSGNNPNPAANRTGSRFMLLHLFGHFPHRFR